MTQDSDWVDAHLAYLPADQRSVLQPLREQIHRALPTATEWFVGGMTAFRLGHQVVVGFKSTKGIGLTLHTFDADVAAALAGQLDGFGIRAGAICFTPDRPLPETAVQAVVEARLAALRAAAEASPYLIQLFRHWPADARIEDVRAYDPLEEAKQAAADRFTAFARSKRSSRHSPWKADLVETSTGRIISRFVMGPGGAFETPGTHKGENGVTYYEQPRD